MRVRERKIELRSLLATSWVMVYSSIRDSQATLRDCLSQVKVRSVFFT